MFVPLVDATPGTCGSKAAALGAMLRAGLPVPDGFVVPVAVYRAEVGDLAQHILVHDGPETAREAVVHHPLPCAVLAALDRALRQFAGTPVAVRSSAADEDTIQASAAGQYDSVLAVCGTRQVGDALRACWASLHSSRAIAYPTRPSRSDKVAMAVIIQRHIDADVSGVMFTPADEDGVTVLESAWGLGPSIVAGTVTPDTYRVHANGTVTRTIADKRTRLDRGGTRLRTRDVPAGSRRRPTLDEATATELAALGTQAATVLGGPQDIEWAVADHRIWLLQARPITATPPPRATLSGASPSSGTLAGTPSGHGTATGTARTVRGAGDFTRVRPGDILICPFTDPAWTPLLHIAAGVVTETGGTLSHAAIVARERGIPAVLAVPGALDSIPDGTTITIDGTTGAVTTPA
jgi:pyruvate,water dikinase